MSFDTHFAYLGRNVEIVTSHINSNAPYPTRIISFHVLDRYLLDFIISAGQTYSFKIGQILYLGKREAYVNICAI